MKNKLLLTLYALLIAGSFGFMGCDDDEKSGSTGAPAAETVTLADLQAIETPIGSGTPPADKTATLELTDNLTDLSDNITSTIEEIVNPHVSDAKKNIKRSVISSLKRSKAPVTDGGTVDLTNSGTINTSSNPSITEIGFLSGSIAWVSGGTYTWSETYDDATEAFSATENGNGSYEVTLNDVETGSGEAILNGFINENFVQNVSMNETFGETGPTSMNANGTFGYSHRSGYSISGTNYGYYVVISADLTASLSLSLTAEQLAEMTEEQIDNAYDDAFTASGSMTVTIYDTSGAQVFQQVFTADDVMAMEDDETEEEPAAVE